ncbi:beta strand repeat-containing protein [Bdellovibrio sp. HCB185ZH]|uniref:beta strand repeat-containing protein n=1 Tax=Bdellovibrio sp. HCB185ZH TaxID=3394235 RepID=UPI0039A77029
MKNLLVLFISFLSANAWADQTWSSGAQSPGTYTGITTITGTTVTLAAGTYNFDTLIISGTATANSNTGSNLGVTINANTVTISGTLKADGTGFGSNAGSGAGNAGGAYGGVGGTGNAGTTHTLGYGSATNPTDLGSGGRNYIGSGGAGGGAIALNVTGTLTVDGTLSARGNTGTNAGGGSGGSLKVSTSTLAGAGTITVAGGTGQGSGGGGRAYIAYSTTNSFSGTFSAAPGTVSGGTAGTAGSFFLVDSTNNDLYINTNSSVPPTEITFRNITIASGVTLSVDYMGSAPQAGTGAGTSQNGASYGGVGGRGVGVPAYTYGSALAPTDLGSGGATYVNRGGVGGGAINLVATGTLTINGNISANGGNGTGSNDGGGSGGSVYLRCATLAGAGSVSAIGGNGISTGGGGGGGRISISYSSSSTYSGTFNTAGGTGSRSGSYGSALLMNTGSNDLFIISTSSIANGTYSFNNVTINSGASLTLDYLGYKNGTGPGAGGNQGGGGHGGTGGYSSGGASYDDPLGPIEMGSGGGDYTNMGGFGGGALKLTVTGTLTVNGSLTANGNGAHAANDGGGAGGSLWLIVGTITGNGTLAANGGNGLSSGGGGGGGRIYVQYTTKTFTGTATASAGTGGSPAPTAGSVIFSGASGGIECGAANSITLNSGDFNASGGNLIVSNGCKLTINGDIFPTTVSVTGAGSILYQNGNLLVTANIDVTSSGVITMGKNTIMSSGYTVSAGAINIASGASITATGMGYSPGDAGSGAPTNGTYGGGGGHGGRGANSTGGTVSVGGSAYGSVYQAKTWGFAGSNGSAGTGGAGGGAITFIVPGTFTVNGTLSTNGVAGSATGGAGGAGGSLWLTVGTIAGTGAITANGANGNGQGGGGGGGYVYVFYNTANTYTTANATAARGTGGNGTAGSTSTVGVVLFTTTGSAATKLVYIGQPSPTVRKNALFSSMPTLVAQDTNSNIVSSFSGTVTLAVFTDSNCTSAASGTLSNSISVVNGVVLSSGVKYDSTGTIYVLASSSGLTSACSSLVKVGGEVATQLVFTTQPPATATAGTDFTSQPVIAARDANGINDILAGVSTVTVYSDAACTTTLSGGTLSGASSVSDGVTTYTGMDYTKAATIYLGASQTLEGNLIKGCSTAIVVSPAAASTLAFTTTSSTTVGAGATFTPNPVVEVQDSYGNIITSWAGTINIGAYTNTGCSTAATGTLTGAGGYSPTSGSLTLTGLSFDTVTTNLRICAQATGLTRDYYTISSVTAGAAAKLAFSIQPAATGVTNVNLRNAQAAVKATDQYGNQVAFTNTPTVKFYTDATCSTVAIPDPSYAGGTTGSGTTRVYTFTSLRYSKAGTYYVGATYGALTIGCSSAVALVNNPPVFFRAY